MKKVQNQFKIQTKYGQFKVFIWRDKKKKVYLVKAADLPEVVTFGASLIEAKRMAKDAIEIYCESMMDVGKIIIDDSRRVVGKLPKSRVLSFTQ